MLVIGCSHGRHRSVVVATAVGDFLYYEGYEVRIIELAMISREMQQVARIIHIVFLGHLVRSIEKQSGDLGRRARVAVDRLAVHQQGHLRGLRAREDGRDRRGEGQALGDRQASPGTYVQTAVGKSSPTDVRLRQARRPMIDNRCRQSAAVGPLVVNHQQMVDNRYRPASADGPQSIWSQLAASVDNRGVHSCESSTDSRQSTRPTPPPIAHTCVLPIAHRW